jgi:hypothetical protein
MIKVIKMDLHGYHPSEIVQTDVLKKIIQQTWEMGENDVTLIHGHGRIRGISPGFFNTNTGYFGLEIRRALRHDKGPEAMDQIYDTGLQRYGCDTR